MIRGADELQKKLDEMHRCNLKRAIKMGIALVQDDARMNCPVHDGELRSKIMTDVTEQGDNVTGVCWPAAAHGTYVELGTGPKGQSEHEGISPNIAVAYTQSAWWIPEGSGDDGIDRETAELYHFPYIDTPNGRFYHCSGQAAQPFLYPALKNNEEKIVEIIKEEVKRQL